MHETLPDRQSIRLKGWDYSSPGWYFVTINTHAGRPLFGTVVKGRMVLSEAGRVAEAEWYKSAELRKGLVLDEFVVMPNHVHGLVRLEGRDRQGGLGAPSPSTPSPSYGKPVAGSLGVFVGAYKAAVSRGRGLARQAPTWHRNYWDVIVRDEQALENIRRYIRNNPQNYETVMQCGEPRMLGNAALMKLPKVGFLASRGEEGLGAKGLDASSPSNAIISGFLSPMERAVFKAGLAEKRPMIWVVPFGAGLAHRTGLMHQTHPIQAALDEGRLLLISPFPDSIEAPSVRRAAWCNEYVLAHCDRMVVGHLNPSGMLACILAERRPELEITYL